jgi:hypothetical protein
VPGVRIRDSSLGEELEVDVVNEGKRRKGTKREQVDLMVKVLYCIS